ncbi:MAG: single-stranded-DNA-specific exonuclease RecJ [Spirochaetaceae bacterium]
MIWEKTEVDKQAIRELSQKYRIDSLPASILYRRGITTPAEIKYYLEDDIRFLHNPFQFKDMEDVIDRLHMAKDEGEKVLVFGDKDVDGVTSTVLLYESLKVLELDLSWKVPMGDDSYGLSTDVVQEAYDSDISLILTVDCGISAFESIAKARELGIDVIIIDHHIPRDGKLPDANFIINPKVEGSGYVFNGLAACGVVSKVVWALAFSLIDTLYKSSLCFLHAETINDVLVISCVKLHNLVKTNSLDLEFNDDGQTAVTKLIDFLRGEQILVYGEDEQKKLIAQVLGSSTDINVIDIKPEVERILPSIIGQPLNNLITHSKMKLYTTEEFRQIDLIVSLFTTYIEKRYTDEFILFENTLDLVALGTVADLMPLKDENRILVKKGLEKLTKTKREGLQALLLKQNILGKDITSKDISWSIAPIINSAGRMKKANIAVDLLLGEVSDLKHKLTLDILALNKERRNISDTLWNSVYPELHNSLQEFHEKVIFLYDPNMVKGVTGIIASRTQNIFNVPAIIVAKEGDYITGSIRSSGELNIDKLFQENSSVLIEWGGHKCAAGFSLKYKDLETFRRSLLKLIKNGSIIEKRPKKENILKIDATIPSNYLDLNIIDVCDSFEPYGEGNKPLNFVTKAVKLVDINFMGKGEKKHLKLLIEIGELKWPAIFWNSADRVGVDFTKQDIVNIAYRVERNFYGGNQTLQLNILDIMK